MGRLTTRDSRFEWSGGITMPSVPGRIVAWLVYQSRCWQGVARLCQLVDRRPLLAVFTFHRVVLDPPPHTHLQGYERGQSLTSFTAQLEAIGRIFDIVSLSEFSDLLSGRILQGRRPVALLTFDDADSLHGRIAFPVLFERGWPGVSFVPTGFIETNRRFYHLRLTNICNHLSASDWTRLLDDQMPVEVKSIIEAHLDTDMSDRQLFRQQLIPVFHTMNVDTRDRLLDAWERLVPGYTLGIECASWAEIKSWQRQGIDIGSHSVNHHRLALLEPGAIEFELITSRQILLQQVGGGVASVSYPEGSYTEAVPALAQEAGYEIGFTTTTGFVMAPIRDSRRYLIPRISIWGDSPYLASYSIGRLMLRHLAESVKRRWRKGPSSGSKLSDIH